MSDNTNKAPTPRTDGLAHTSEDTPWNDWVQASFARALIRRHAPRTEPTNGVQMEMAI